MKDVDNSWREQAEAAIKQGQSLNDFVMHCHPDNRRKARKTYLAVKWFNSAPNQTTH